MQGWILQIWAGWQDRKILLAPWLRKKKLIVFMYVLQLLKLSSSSSLIHTGSSNLWHSKDLLLFVCSLVQNVLEHVVSAVPQSGLQILTLAKNLAYKQLEVFSDSKTSKVIVDFLIQLSTIIASEVPGARKDIKELPWKKLPLIPNDEEMKKPSILNFSAEIFAVPISLQVWTFQPYHWLS